MPNGGTDNCMNCWFNLRNREHPTSQPAGRTDPQRTALERRKRLQRNLRVGPDSDYCTIRDLIIEERAYTYCANFCPDISTPASIPGPIPIGPVTRGLERSVWVRSPDSEKIRLRLLELLEQSFQRATRTAQLTKVVVSQLGQFRERRATHILQRIVEEQGAYADVAADSLASICQGPRGVPTPRV